MSLKYDSEVRVSKSVPQDREWRGCWAVSDIVSVFQKAETSDAVSCLRDHRRSLYYPQEHSKTRLSPSQRSPCKSKLLLRIKLQNRLYHLYQHYYN